MGVTSTSIAVTPTSGNTVAIPAYFYRRELYLRNRGPCRVWLAFNEEAFITQGFYINTNDTLIISGLACTRDIYFVTDVACGSSEIYVEMNPGDSEALNASSSSSSSSSTSSEEFSTSSSSSTSSDSSESIGNFSSSSSSYSSQSTESSSESSESEDNYSSSTSSTSSSSESTDLSESTQSNSSLSSSSESTDLSESTQSNSSLSSNSISSESIGNVSSSSSSSLSSLSTESSSESSIVDRGPIPASYWPMPASTHFYINSTEWVSGTTFYESSSGYQQGKTMVRNSCTQNVSSGNNYWSGFNDTQYLYASGVSMGTNDWTWEAWVRLTTTDYDTNFICNNTSGITDIGLEFYITNDNKFHCKAGNGPGMGENVGRLDGTSEVPNDWTHLAVVRQSSNWRLYVDGTQEDVNSIGGTSFGIQAYQMSIGHSLYGGNNEILKGWIDKFRWTSTVMYPDGTSFTPPDRTEV